jgi:hypothetical protein
MALLYTFTVKKTVENIGVADFPPQLIENNWYETFQARSFAFSGDTGKKTIIRAMYFADSTVATAWFSKNRLTDSALLTVLNEWKTNYNITYEEKWHELPEYSAGISGIFG